ncbi:hypothetical protein [Endozoicomonas lisbonensis]|uniref:Primase C-terminal 1 domain-containing protein n=1 Tax=Endozoicomonas lisbonensis TaxID=3120522 RepID=A0ABV2SP55_9GAMM
MDSQTNERATLGRVKHALKQPCGKLKIEVIVYPGFSVSPGEEIAVAKLEAPPIYGQLAKALYQSGVMQLPTVAAALGHDDDYQAWTRLQACIVTKQEPVEYAHVRRAYNSGIGYKPLFSGVPLASEVHRKQHQNGELSCLLHYGKRVTTVTEAREWFDKAAAHNLRRWTWEKLRDAIGVTSMREANPVRVMEWFDRNGLSAAVPKPYRSAVDALN